MSTVAAMNISHSTRIIILLANKRNIKLLGTVINNFVSSCVHNKKKESAKKQ